ncbi:hypothetical protein KG088_08700 [Halomonas sp. TRM85114]|uniref:hypothetical protein n=1 Tax=Halomonas jincaotanensis TaxID=2810616 RepID=UPI001BD28956|nr:hypothetical protein [Halomonas jincaotanensis]MBS9403707.1 hypothetical protein [Halomonas jincaotanensis]
MPPSLSFETCHALTLLTRQLLEAGESQTHTHVLAQGRVYRVVVSLEPVPEDQLQDVITQYL